MGFNIKHFFSRKKPPTQLSLFPKYNSTPSESQETNKNQLLIENDFVKDPSQLTFDFTEFNCCPTHLGYISFLEPQETELPNIYYQSPLSCISEDNIIQYLEISQNEYLATEFYDSETISPAEQTQQLQNFIETSKILTEPEFAFEFKLKFLAYPLLLALFVLDFITNAQNRFAKITKSIVSGLKSPQPGLLWIGKIAILPIVIVLSFGYSSQYAKPKYPVKASLDYLSNPYSPLQATSYISGEFNSLGKALGSNTSATLLLANFSNPKSPVKVSAWLPWWGWNSGLDSSLANQNALGDISAFLYTLNIDGSITLKKDMPYLSNSINRVHAAGYKIEATISEEPNASAISAMFATKDSRSKLISTILTTTNQFDGVDIDFEALQFSSNESDKAKIRILYPTFLMELGEKLHAQGKTLSVSVGSRTSVSDPNWNVYDYQSIGLIADKVKIMAYDLHNSKSNPGPVSSKTWINQILDYSLSVIASDKVTVGLPSYSYLWSSDGKVTVITGDNLNSFIQTHKGNFTRDPESDMAHLSYSTNGINYDLYYPDQQFYQDVLSDLKDRKITSIGIWSIGNESQDLWASLK